jgi:hypothetical protein
MNIITRNRKVMMEKIISIGLGIWVDKRQKK